MEKVAEVVKKRIILSLRKRKRIEDSLYPIVSEGDQEQNQPPNNHFASPVRDEVMMKDKLGVVPNNTLQANQWALRNCFVQETRKEDGQLYPPHSLKQLLCGLKRIMDSNRVPLQIIQ